MSGPRLLAAVVIAALIVATGIAAEGAWESERDRVAERHQAEAREAAASVRLAFDAMLAKTVGTSGLIKDSGGLRRRGFRLFARRAIRQEGFVAIAWHPLITAKRRTTFEESAGPIVSPDPEGGMEPAPRQALYLPVRLMEGSLRRRISLGLDILSVPELVGPAQRARDNAVPSASIPMPMLGSGVEGVVVVRPVYQQGRPIGTRPGRRKSLAGVISVSIAADRLTRELGTALQPGTKLEIEDEGTPLVDLDGDQADDASAPVGVAGRPWIVSIGGLTGPSEVSAVAIAAAGLSLAMLIAVLLTAATRRERMLEASRAKAERTAARESMLVRVGDALERTASIEGRLDEFARTIVPGLADLCSVDLLEETGLHRVGVGAADPQAERILRNLQAGERLREAMTVGAVTLVPEVDDPTMRSMSVDEDEFQARRGLGSESMIVAPLRARSRSLGVLTLYTTKASSRPRFTEEDATLAAEIADRAALALDNARLYEEQLNIAQTLQRALLPRHLPNPEQMEVAARHRAGREGTEVGGDFYDFFDGAGRWIAAVGDVCGKGAEAAALTGLVRHTLRASAEFEGPAKTLAQVDRAIYNETHGTTFCTLVCASIDHVEPGNGSVHATTATGGHPEPLLLRATGAVERLPRTGPLLGITNRATFEETDIKLEPGDTMLLFTDGVTEARADGELFGETRLIELARKWSALPVDQLLARLEEEVVAFSDAGRPQDDIAMLAIRILPS